MAATFDDFCTEQSAWGNEFSFLLRLFSQWLKENGLLDSGIVARIARLEHQVRVGKVTIAFVAEFSRGKSELINALFFADYGRRILPAGLGRTTMCPTEIGYESGTATCLRLLPIQTRLHPQSLLDWRAVPEAWVRCELDLSNAEQLASALERVTETLLVSSDEAQALGFFQPRNPPTGARLESQGMVEIPRWRHALVNIFHPLLEKGLVILDTPGLNAIDSEPEHTLGLMAQAHAVVFVLGADTAVTQSDLSIWRDHLAKGEDGGPRQMVVLNKLDVLWDTLSSQDHVRGQVASQIASVAQKLRLEPDQILAVSAKSALIAKFSNNADLLSKSRISDLEAALVYGMLGQGNQLVSTAVHIALKQLQLDLGRAIQTRKSATAEALADLRGMQNKTKAVLNQMRCQVAAERQQIELCCTKLSALISVQAKLFRELFLALDEQSLRQEMQALVAVLAQPGLKLGAKNAYGKTFDCLHHRMSAAQALVEEIRAMHAAAFEQLNNQLKFSLGTVTPPSLEPHRYELTLAQLHHAKYLGLQNAFRLQQPRFVQRLTQELFARLLRLRHGMVADLVVWRNSLVGELDAQLGSKRVTLEQRQETVLKLEQAALGIAQRTEQLSSFHLELEVLEQKLDEHTACLLATNDDGRRLNASLFA